MAAGFAASPGCVAGGTCAVPVGATPWGPFSMAGGPACPGACGSRRAGVPVTGRPSTTAGDAPCPGLRSVGNCGRPATAAPGAATAGVTRMAGPSATGRVPGAGAWKLNCRATAGVTPTVVAAGRTGCSPNTGLAWASCCGVTRCATPEIGRDAVIAFAGTTVAAPRLTKLLIVTLRLMVVMLVTLVTWVMLTLRT